MAKLNSRPTPNEWAEKMLKRERRQKNGATLAGVLGGAVGSLVKLAAYVLLIIYLYQQISWAT